MSTLYRKYRPQTFGEVVGQNHIKVTLQHEIVSGRIAHAYLFSGPRGVSKTTLARVLAKAVNCLNRQEGEYDPCNKCEMCVDTTIGRNLDVVEIDAASHTGVDNVRENIIAASRISGKAKYKVFIIDEVHMLSSSAFNALLKVLEEPPKNVIFILCTTEVYKIPATIISRCQRFDFRRISLSDTVKKLQYIIDKEGIKMEKSILEEVARHSEGHMRDAESLLGQIVAISGKEITREEADLVIPRSDLAEAMKLVAMLSRKDAPGSIGLVNRLVDEGVSLKRFTADFLELMRNVMLAKASPVLGEKLGMELGETMEGELSTILPNLTLEAAVQIIDRFNEAKEELKNSFIIQMPIEVAIVKICYAVTHVHAPAVPRGPVSGQAAKGPIAQANVVRESPETTYQASHSSPADDMDRETVMSKWGEVLMRVKKDNHSLSFVLRSCQPSGISAGKISLIFKYKIHKDRLNDQAIMSAIESVLGEVFGGKVTVDAVLDESLNLNIIENGGKNPAADNATENASVVSDEEEKNLLNNLLTTFGGKIVS